MLNKQIINLFGHYNVEILQNFFFAMHLILLICVSELYVIRNYYFLPTLHFVYFGHWHSKVFVASSMKWFAELAHLLQKFVRLYK